MLDRRKVSGARGIAAANVVRHRLSRWLSAMDMADKALCFHEGLVLLRAVGAVGPHTRTSICLVEKTPAQEPAVVATGIRNVPAPDEPQGLANRRMGLVAEGGMAMSRGLVPSGFALALPT